ncbi:LysR family transcriptional regulator [Kosakonia sp. H02]|nr:LysR family transcriptional regulator [Kosakonia sp. H02]
MKGSEYTELVAFLAVAEEKNFRRAAQRLGISPSAVSHTIRALETRLRIRLFNRTTRSVSLTDAGLHFMTHLSPAMKALSDAVENAGETQLMPRGRVRLNMSRLAAQRVILPRLDEFMSRYPDIRLDLVIDDHLEDVVGAGFDAGIRTGDHVPRDMIAVRVSPDLKMIVVAAPACFAGLPLPERPEALSQHRIVNYRWRENSAQYRWVLQHQQEAVEIPVTAAFTVNDNDMLLAAAERGAGLALLEEGHVSDALAAGRLIHILPQWYQPVAGFYLYFPRNAFMTPAMRALVDFIRH